ncbi:structural cement protein Gp24 [Xanthomonas phaseoli]|uniref:structural cement protein Gp24 n=1 Tax=Xanthomonas phaseoli TaxID=1985254 RepID=UPI003D18C8A8
MNRLYTASMVGPVAGARATDVPINVLSGTVESEAPIGFGQPVARGADPGGLISFAGGSLLGISLIDLSAQPVGYAKHASVPYMDTGDIWVVASAAVAAGDPVCVTPTGQFTNVTAGNTTWSRARWDTSTTRAGQPAVIRR